MTSLISPVPAWELLKFLQGAGNYTQLIMPAIGLIVGSVCLVWGLIIVAKGLMSSSGQPTPWMKAIALIFIGGLLAFSQGFDLYTNIGKGMKTTVDNMGNGGTAAVLVQKAPEVRNVIK